MGKRVLARAISIGIGSVCLASCVQIPQRDGIAAANVNAVIRRIKCDLNRIVIEKAYQEVKGEVAPERRYPFLFLRSWAAKVRLTMAVDDTGQISPGASYTTPLRAVNNVAQSFTLGVGGSLTTQAIRQEDVEFLLSFKDIEKENDSGLMQSALYHGCQPEPGLLLESDLGLDRLIEAALKPVETGILKPGNNIGPNAGAPPAIPKADLSKVSVEKRKVDPLVPSINQLGGQSLRLNQFSLKLIQKFQIPPDVLDLNSDQLKSSSQPAKENAEKVQKLLENATEGTTIETRTQAIINNIVKPRYNIALGSLDSSCVKPIADSQFEALAHSANVSAFVIDIDKAAETAAGDIKIEEAVAKSNNALKKADDARDKVVEATNRMADAMQRCANLTTRLIAQRKKDGPPVYDPISIISETVNFYVTVTGNVTPTWRLVRATAPLSGTFLSGTRKDTNTLILTLGRPVPGANGGAQASPAMDQQTLYSILGQAISNTRP